MCVDREALEVPGTSKYSGTFSYLERVRILKYFQHGQHGACTCKISGRVTEKHAQITITVIVIITHSLTVNCLTVNLACLHKPTHSRTHKQILLLLPPFQQVLLSKQPWDPPITTTTMLLRLHQDQDQQGRRRRRPLPVVRTMRHNNNNNNRNSNK